MSKSKKHHQWYKSILLSPEKTKELESKWIGGTQRDFNKAAKVVTK